jgi:hypothetical protein
VEITYYVPFAVGDATTEAAVMVFPTANVDEANRARKRREKMLRVKLDIADRAMISDFWCLVVYGERI